MLSGSRWLVGKQENKQKYNQSYNLHSCLWFRFIFTFDTNVFTQALEEPVVKQK